MSYSGYGAEQAPGGAVGVGHLFGSIHPAAGTYWNVGRPGPIGAAFAGLSLFVVAMVCSRIVYTGTSDHSAILWNLALAWAPFGVAVLVRRQADAGGSAQALAWAAALWLILLPNAPYTVTDLRYAGFSDRVPVLYDVVLLSAAAWTGLLLGFTSLFLMQGVARRLRGSRAGWTLVACALTLSSFGIYLGRVRRLNSWDLFVQPRRLGAGVAHGLVDPRAILLTLLLTAFLLAAYLTVYVLGASSAGAEPGESQPEARRRRVGADGAVQAPGGTLRR